MRILVVDDELVSRTKLDTLMRSFGQCEAAENGSQALDLFQHALDHGRSFDLVMLDINMPDMQGTEVLQRIRFLEKKADPSGGCDTGVIMVTAQSDQEHVMTCIQNGCDDYITKPFNIKIIKEKLIKLGFIGNQDNVRARPSRTDRPTAETLFKDISSALRNGELRLPALPRIGVQFRKLVRANADLDEMAELLKKDVVMVSKLIRVANSALYRGYGKVQTVEQAIGRIGLSEAEQLVTAITNQQLFLNDQSKYRALLQTLWEHSVACAYGAEILCHSLARKPAVDLYTAGLFHDVGALALINIIAAMEKNGHYDQGIDNDALQETIEAYHAMFGAKLLENWEFENDYVHVALYHNNLDTADSQTDELLIVHFANQVAKSLGYTALGGPPTVDLIDAPSAAKLKLTGPQIATLQHKVKACMLKLEEVSN